MNHKQRRRHPPNSFRDYFTKVMPRSTSEQRLALEQLLIGIASHQERWAGLQRATARDQRRAILGHCDKCNQRSDDASTSAAVPIQLVDGLMACLLGGDEVMGITDKLQALVRARSVATRVKHQSIDDYCREVAQDDWPAGYLVAMIHGLQDLVWDFDDAQYPLWVLQVLEMIFNNKHFPRLGYTWRPLLPRDERVRINCCVGPTWAKSSAPIGPLRPESSEKR